MQCIFIIFIFGFITYAQAGSDIGYNYAQSASSKTHKARLGLQIGTEHKLAFSGSTTQLNSADYPDAQNSIFKLSDRYKINDISQATVEFKKVNESYFFEGQSLSAQYSHRFQIPPMNNLATKVTGKIEAGGRKYTELSDENLSMNTFELSFEQELPQQFTAGLDFSFLNYDSKSPQLNSALQGQTVTENNINLYTASLTKRSVGLFLEYTKDDFAVGGSISQDTPLISGQAKYNTFEIYGDYQIQDNLSLNASLTRGRLVEANSTLTSTVSLGIQYQF